MDQPPVPQDRAIRIFISSTFQDMQAEREELMKRVVPALVARCRERGVFLDVVDLRWGVTAEDRDAGRLLPICLGEIDGCRPFFIGLLGERYGWVPDALPASVVADMPWLEPLRGYSITAIEIHHAVLRDGADAPHAYFYFRDPAWIRRQPASARSHFMEVAQPDEIKHLGRKEAELRARDRSRRLGELKGLIRGSGLPLWDGYPDPVALGQRVRADLEALIDRLYPAEEVPGGLERERQAHAHYARERTRGMLPREAWLDRINVELDRSGAVLLVGPAGSGKTVLAGSWAQRHAARASEGGILTHFADASPLASGLTAVRRRLVRELAARLRKPVPDLSSEFEVDAAWRDSLRAAAGAKTELLVDGLDRLVDEAGIDRVLAAFGDPPPGLRVVATCRSDEASAALARKGWRVLVLDALEPEERRLLAGSYLERYSKRLTPAQLERIVRAPAAGSPLFLALMLEELRLWGRHEQLDAELDRLLGAPDVDALYRMLLERLEREFDRDRPNLVRDALSLLWASRRGLTESELMAMLGGRSWLSDAMQKGAKPARDRRRPPLQRLSDWVSRAAMEEVLASQGIFDEEYGRDPMPLPRARWAPMRLALGNHLANRSGLLSFAHEPLRSAVQRAYVADDAARSRARRHLAAALLAEPMSPRVIEEVPWALADEGLWPRLFAMLSQPRSFDQFWTSDPDGLLAVWDRVERLSRYRRDQAYAPVIEAAAEQPVLRLENLASFFERSGNVALADRLRADVEGRASPEDLRALLFARLDAADVAEENREFATAGRLAESAVALARRLADTSLESLALSRWIWIERVAGHWDHVFDLASEFERVATARGDAAEVAEALHHLGWALMLRGDLPGARDAFVRQEAVARDVEPRFLLEWALESQRRIALHEGRQEDAQALAARLAEAQARAAHPPTGEATPESASAPGIADERTAGILQSEAIRQSVTESLADRLGVLRAILPGLLFGVVLIGPMLYLGVAVGPLVGAQYLVLLMLVGPLLRGVRLMNETDVPGPRIRGAVLRVLLMLVRDTIVWLVTMIVVGFPLMLFGYVVKALALERVHVVPGAGRMVFTLLGVMLALAVAIPWLAGKRPWADAEEKPNRLRRLIGDPTLGWVLLLGALIPYFAAVLSLGGAGTLSTLDAPHAFGVVLGAFKDLLTQDAALVTRHTLEGLHVTLDRVGWLQYLFIRYVLAGWCLVYFVRLGRHAAAGARRGPTAATGAAPAS